MNHIPAYLIPILGTTSLALSTFDRNPFDLLRLSIYNDFRSIMTFDHIVVCVCNLIQTPSETLFQIEIEKVKKVEEI